VLLTDAAASLAAATATTDSNLTTEDSRMNLDNNVNESTNKGEGPEAISSNVSENQPPPAAGDQNNTLTNVSHINPATGNVATNAANATMETMMTTPKTMPSICPHPHVIGTQTMPRSNPLHHNININAVI
jgi:hypothetical protein